jgi:hypothetical protein
VTSVVAPGHRAATSDNHDGEGANAGGCSTVTTVVAPILAKPLRGSEHDDV